MENQPDNSNIWPRSQLHSTDYSWCAERHWERCLPVLADLLYDLRHNNAEITEEFLAFIVAEVALGERL